MMKVFKSKEEEPTAPGQVSIKKRSRVPGVMITQFVEGIPPGKSHPDFSRKPIALTIQEGKLAVFKAIVTGDPTPTIRWIRSNGDTSDKEKYITVYNQVTGEHQLQMPNVAVDQADTYKCLAENELGFATVTAALNVIEIGFNKSKALQEARRAQREHPADFKKTLKTRADRPKNERKDGEVDEKFWELLLSADRKDYERICAEYGVTDFRWMLKKLNEKKREIEEQQAQYIDYLGNLKHIEMKSPACAQFEFEIDLKDPNARIFLYKDGNMIPFSSDTDEKHSLHQIGRRLIFSVNGLTQDDAGLYQVDIEGVNVFSTDFKIPVVDFLVKIQEVKAIEREDAVFECVLSAPFAKITWMGKSTPLVQGKKYGITVSEDMLIHRLLVKDCMKVDTGIYAAVAGIKSCNAWLIVEADNNPNNHGKKAARKTTQAGGSGDDLSKVAAQQQAKLQKAREEKTEMLKQHQAKQAVVPQAYEHEPMTKPPTGPQTKPLAQTSCRLPVKPPTMLPAESSSKPPSTPPAEHPSKSPSTPPTKPPTMPPGESPSKTPAMPPAESLPKPPTTLPVETLSKLPTIPSAEPLSKPPPTPPAEPLSKPPTTPPAEPPSKHPTQPPTTPPAEPPCKPPTTPTAEPPVKPPVTSPDESKDQIKPNDKPIPKSLCEGVNEKTLEELEKEDKNMEKEEPEPENRYHGYGQTTPESLSEVVERKKNVRTGPLVPNSIIAPGVHFTCGLQDVRAIMGQTAEMVCKLSSTNCNGVWYKDGKELKSIDDLKIIKDGAFHKLLISNCKEDDNGKYRFEADGHKTEAILIVEDPPKINKDDLTKFSEPVIIKVGQNATFSLSFVGKEPVKIHWYNKAEELFNGTNIKIEKSSSHSSLLLTKCQRKDTGEIKLKLKNEFGTTEAFSSLIVLDKPTHPVGPTEVIEASSSCVEFKWRPPKDDGGSSVTQYNLERQQLGRNTWKKIGNIPGEAHYKDTDVDHGRKYCYRIRAITAEGISDVFETDDIQAGTKAYPGPPSTPKVDSAFKECINLSWAPPTKTGGTSIVGYNLEKRKRGSNLWSQVNPPDEPIRAKKYGVKDVVEGIEYEFRVSAINFSGVGDPSSPTEFVIARDPKKPPAKVIDLKVLDSTYSSLSLSWSKPKVEKGVQDEAKGYFVELRPAENTEWTHCNSNAIISTSFTILGLKSMAMYWVRVIATNEGGNGEPRDLDNYVIAMPPPVRPNFLDRKLKSFMVVRAGNSARVNITFEASPMANIIWVKDGIPMNKRVTVSNTEGTSQLLIPSAERCDSGIYTITVKNIVGQETFSTEIRVTDDPKPPGPVELEENVPGTLTMSWSPSPDEKQDDRLHYTVAQRDSVKQTWHTVADHLFNNNFTAVNIMPGREYNFRVYAKNDMGLSQASKSPTWGIIRKKEKLTLNIPEPKTCNLDSAPIFTVPLKAHISPEKYECYMSCAVRGNPSPHITWYHNNISINTNTNYYITNTCGVCSLLILRVGSKDNGEYKVVAENSVGHAECTTKLTVRE
ncbi:immunoglobulin-like and fibronectin type III domain-containing protein 1 [Electrophorus electricus]|uniref:immunoglobulin-like and fibronectin type III domain-containing protein 1 n=1 Tax=Electrophorus electricus TaxID=8005 RepID=UPI0015CF9686|nr:immunoglobulin-like and fibronectin type III domain-containing protein 1 [Electrophorus electricus]